MNRKLELPSFADQLKLATSSCRVNNRSSAVHPISAADDENGLKRGVSRKEQQQRQTSSDTMNGTIASLATPPNNECNSPAKSALKKVSSYGRMEEIGQDIPIRTENKNWKNLPAPTLPGVESNKETKKGSNNSNNKHLEKSVNDAKMQLLLKKTSSSSPCLMLPPNTTAESFQKSTTQQSLSSNDHSNNTMKRNVSFSDVIIRDYAVTAGDGACHTGPPVALDWFYEEHDPIKVAHYEECRPAQPRSQSEMHLTSGTRKMLLKELGGLAESEIQAAAKQAEKTFKQRSQTVQRLPFMKLEDMIESATRKARRLASKAIKKTGSSSNFGRLSRVSSAPSLVA